MANIVALKCPSCNGDVQLDVTREFGFCTYCGTKILVADAVQRIKGVVSVDRSDTLQSYLVLGRRSIEIRDYIEALKNYDQALIINPYDNHAILGKSIAMAALSSPESPQGLQYLKQYGVSSFSEIQKTNVDGRYQFEVDTMIDLANVMVCAFAPNFSRYRNMNIAEKLFKEMAAIFDTFCSCIADDDFSKSKKLIDCYEQLCSTVITTGTVLQAQVGGLVFDERFAGFDKRKEKIKDLRVNCIAMYWREHSDEYSMLKTKERRIERRIKETGFFEISKRSSLKQKLRDVVDRLNNPYLQ